MSLFPKKKRDSIFLVIGLIIKTDPQMATYFSGIPANVAALLPSTSDPSSHSSSPHTVPSTTTAAAAVASQSQASTAPALAINHEQLAALAKFASNSQTRSGEHDFPPFPPPPPLQPHPIPSTVTFQSQPYIPPPKPFSPPAAAARYPVSSRDRDPRERDPFNRYTDKQNGGRDSRLVAQSMSSSSSSPDKHRQNDNWRAGRQGGGGEKRSRSRSPDRRTNGHRLNRSAISSLPNLPPPPLLPISSQQSSRWMDNPSVTAMTAMATTTTARLTQGRGIVEGDGEEDMALDVSDEEERAKGGTTVAQAAYPPSNVPPPYLSAPPPVAPPFPPPSSASAPQQHQQQQQQTPISISSSLQPTNRRNDLVTLHTFPLQTFDPSSAESWAKLGEAWQNSTGREPEQIELMHWLATGQIMDFKMMRMGMGMDMDMGMDMGMGMNMSHENGDSSSHVSQGDMNGLSSSATANPATGLLPPSHLSMRGGDQWNHVQGQAQWGNNDSWRQQGAEGQGY